VLRIVLKGKIHRARVTEHNLHYEGSITIDEALMEAAGLLPYEQVQVYNVSNGNRFETYVIRGERGSGIIGINGAAAHLAKKGDIVIIASYGLLDEEELKDHHPKLVYVDEDNSIVKIVEG